MGFDSERGMEIETGKRIERGMEKVRVRGIEVEREEESNTLGKGQALNQVK